MTAADASIEAWLPEKTQFRLMGTVHGDPRGFRRLRCFLEEYQPNLILVEMSPLAWAYRNTHARGLHRTLTDNARQAAILNGWNLQWVLSHPQVQAIRRQIAMPFEFRASCRYARAKKQWLLLIDRSDFSVPLLAQWLELLSVRNLSLLLSLPASNAPLSTMSHYQKARREIYPFQVQTTSAKPDTPDGGTENHWLEREYSLAERVRSAVAAVMPQRCVYVGGWEHLRSQVGSITLRSLLGVTLDRCQLLDYFDR